MSYVVGQVTSIGSRNSPCYFSMLAPRTGFDYLTWFACSGFSSCSETSSPVSFHSLKHTNISFLCHCCAICRYYCPYAHSKDERRQPVTPSAPGRLMW